MYEFDINKELKQCQDSAAIGYNLSMNQFTNLKKSLQSAQERIESNIAALSNSGCNFSEITSSLENQLSDIKTSFSKLADVTKHDLASLKKQLSKFSITLFGKTMAGKSTLMEILRHGDGSSIGQGAQRTTRDVRTYEWNGLSITDVPGIGAFEGKEDEKIAFQAAKSSDVILFLITDDAPNAVDAEWFSKIVKLGKPIICIVNVKASVNLEKSQNFIQQQINDRFDIDKLNGIKNQFLAYAQKAGQECNHIPFVYVHLRSAFLSQQEENEEKAATLFSLSRIDN